MGIQALYTAATGMEAQLRKIDVIANNVANLNTEGFRRDRVNFADLFYSQFALAGGESGGPGRPSGIHIGHGVEIVSTEKVFERGGIIHTGNDFHLAIQDNGNHFFRVQLVDGTVAYTRAGNFLVDSQGQMVTPSGHSLDPPVILPPEFIGATITDQGLVEAKTNIAEPAQQVGEITLTRFVNPAGLVPGGDNLFFYSEAAGEPLEVEPGIGGNVSLLQGSLEGSNVNAITELIELIQGQRAYEINSNVIETADEALQIANNLRA